MTSLTNATVLVIGAAGGIGQSLCAALHAAGATVIGTTKDAGKLSSLATTTSSQRVLDLADGDSIAAFLDDIEADDVALTGIIVAAGVVGFGNAVDVPAAGFDRMMAINATGPIHVLSALSPIVRKSGDGFVERLAIFNRVLSGSDATFTLMASARRPGSSTRPPDSPEPSLTLEAVLSSCFSVVDLTRDSREPEPRDPELRDRLDESWDLPSI